MRLSTYDLPLLDTSLDPYSESLMDPGVTGIFLLRSVFTFGVYIEFYKTVGAENFIRLFSRFK